MVKPSAIMQNFLPRQDIFEKDKTPAWMSLHLDFAEYRLKSFDMNRGRMTRFLDAYNGVKLPTSLEWLEKTYGKQNRSKYIAYRLGRTKISLMHGEWLKRPLSSTVTTINSEAMSAKMQQLDFMMGAMIAKPELSTLKEKAGIDVMEGAPIPDSLDDPLWEKMAPKDKCEDIMQIILDNQTLDLDMKSKLGDAFLYAVITNHCFFQIERDQTGEIQAHHIDIRDAIYELVEGDWYLEKSPIMGCRRTLSIHEILLRYELTKDQRNTLEAARANSSRYTGVDGLSRGYMRMSNGELVCDVIHIEWKSVTPEYYKKVKKTASQATFDLEGDSEYMELPMNTVQYETNKEMHDKNVADGLYEIVIKYKEDEYEATRIGGMIDINMRRTFFQKRSVDKPAHILSSSYYGYVHGMVNGVTVSLQQIIENFDNMFDICMYQILKELARAKGKALGYDRATLPINTSTKDIMYRALNDQFIEYDSSATGNQSGTRVDITTMFKEIDLGLSQSFQFLLTLKQDIINTLNQITGINESREGNTAASSTATNAQADIANSRTITEALFYGFNGFVTRVMKGVVDSSAISWAFYKLEKGEQILGASKLKYLQLTKEIGYRDYGVHVEDGGHYMEIKQDIKRMMGFSLNAKEIRPMDALNVLLSNTVSEMKNKLNNSWIEMQKVMQQSQQSEQQAQAQQQQMQLQTQIQMTQDALAAKEKSEKENIVLKGQVQMQVDNNKAKNDLFHTSLDHENDIINQPPV